MHGQKNIKNGGKNHELNNGKEADFPHRIKYHINVKI
jgi:hypothetical protein